MTKANRKKIIEVSEKRFAVCVFLIAAYISLWAVLRDIERYSSVKTYMIAGAGFGFLYVLFYGYLLTRFVVFNAKWLRIGKFLYDSNLYYSIIFIAHMIVIYSMPDDGTTIGKAISSLFTLLIALILFSLIKDMIVIPGSDVDDWVEIRINTLNKAKNKLDKMKNKSGITNKKLKKQEHKISELEELISNAKDNRTMEDIF